VGGGCSLEVEADLAHDRARQHRAKAYVGSTGTVEVGRELAGFEKEQAGRWFATGDDLLAGCQIPSLELGDQVGDLALIFECLGKDVADEDNGLWFPPDPR
jgi:hypothetical protein